MAAATIAAIGGLASAGFQTYQGIKQQKEAKSALNSYNRQDLSGSNAYENMPISTIGSDIMREDNQIGSANTVDAIRGMGTRGIGMLPGVVAANNNANRETRNYLDDQVNKRGYAIAGDNASIRSMQEERENADLAGLGNQMQVGDQNMWSGIRGVGSSLNYLGNNMDFTKNRPQVEGVGSSLKPVGISALKSKPSITASLPDYSRLYKNGF